MHVSCAICKYSYGWMYVYSLWGVEARNKDQVFLVILNLLGFFVLFYFFRQGTSLNLELGYLSGQ